MVHPGRRVVDDAIDHLESLVAVVPLPDGEVQMRPVVALSDSPPPVPIKISRIIPPAPARPAPSAKTTAEDLQKIRESLQEAAVVACKKSGKAPPPPIPETEIPLEEIQQLMQDRLKKDLSHPLVEPALDTGPLARGLEMTRMDRALERLYGLEEEHGLLVDTDDYGDDADAMEDCFAPHNYKKAHRASPRPPHTHTR